MITLKNIKVLNNIIYADCYIEDSNSIFFTICVDALKKEIVKYSLENMNTYVYMAAKRLYKLTENNEPIPTQITYTWY